MRRPFEHDGSVRISPWLHLTCSMRSTASIVLSSMLALCCLSCHSLRPKTDDPRVSWTPFEGHEYLVVARGFALGGVGYAGQTSTGEYAFRAVMRAHNASDVFKAILSPQVETTDEGKLYALCGLRARDRAAFDAYSTTLTGSNAEVTTIRGCLTCKQKVAEVVKQIGDGYYDSELSDDRWADNRMQMKRSYAVEYWKYGIDQLRNTKPAPAPSGSR